MTTPIRMVSIDPGSNFVGLSASEFDYDFQEMVVVDSITLRLPRIVKRFHEPMANHHGETFAKLHALRHAVERYMVAWKPSIACCEAPYMGEFPTAYARLVESITAIRMGAMAYDPTLVVTLIDPSTVKMHAGVVGRKSSDKNLVKEALLKLPDLTSVVLLDLLDEHAVDSIAVGYSHFITRLKQEV